jgi:hypothetical protein
MDKELAELLERTRIQIGVGLQSTDERVLERVGRRFDVGRFEESLKVLGSRRINWYVDVMFGLPGDDMRGFRRTVDRVVEFGPSFVMPFPLTVIPRTELAADLEGYEVVRYEDEQVRSAVRPVSGMVYEEVGLYRAVDLDDLKRFDEVATAIFVAMQRFPEAVQALVGYGSAFDVLEQIGRGIKHRMGGVVIDPANPPLIDGAIREATAAFMSAQGAADVELEAVLALMRLEAAIDLMLRRTDRRVFHHKVAGRTDRRAELGTVGDPVAPELTVAFAVEHRLLRSQFAYDDLVRLAELRERIAPRDTRLAVIAPYDDFRVRVVELAPIDVALCEVVPSGREVGLAKVVRRVERVGEGWREALARLVDVGLLGIYRAA